MFRNNKVGYLKSTTSEVLLSDSVEYSIDAVQLLVDLAWHSVEHTACDILSQTSATGSAVLALL